GRAGHAGDRGPGRGQARRSPARPSRDRLDRGDAPEASADPDPRSRRGVLLSVGLRAVRHREPRGHGVRGAGRCHGDGRDPGGGGRTGERAAPRPCARPGDGPGGTSPRARAVHVERRGREDARDLPAGLLRAADWTVAVRRRRARRLTHVGPRLHYRWVPPTPLPPTWASPRTRV